MRHRVLAVLVALLCVCFPSGVAAAIVTFSATGATNTDAALLAAIASFRTAVGSLNPNVAGSFGTGRREINWDGVPDQFSAPNNLPGNFFNTNSPRGTVLSTPGTGLQVSANAGVAPVQFGNIDPNFPNYFEPFSPQKLFTALGSTVTDVNFFVPGTNTASYTTAFGAIFSDVNLPNVTSLQFFTPLGVSLGTFFVTPNPLGVNAFQTFSFLGVQFTGGEQIGRVRINSGNQLLTPGNNLFDLVTMDDFIYAEPAPVPEPTTGLLLLAGAGLARLASRRSRRAA